MKRAFIITVLTMVSAALCAQDSIAIDIISFEYDEGGAIVKKEIIMQEDQEKSQETQRFSREQQKRGLEPNHENHLILGNSTENGIIKILLPNYTDYTERSLTIHHLSGILQYATTINDAISVIDLRNFPQGVYVATLTLDEEKEVLKVKR